MSSKLSTVIISALVAAVVAVGIVHWGGGTATVSGGIKAEDLTVSHIHQPVFERIEKTNTVRCGYVVYPPAIARDPNTGKLSGIFVDLTERLGQLMGWKIEWTYETSFAVMTQDLNSDRFDVYCGGSWPVIKTQKAQHGSIPVFYSGVGLYVREDDTRFGKDFDVRQLNSPQYTFATIDGEAADLIQVQDFPKAKTFSMPQMIEVSFLGENVATRKADVAIIEVSVANEYMKRSGKKLRNLVPNAPVRIYGNAWEFPYGEIKLKNVFESAIREITYGGYVDHVLDTYESATNSYYRIAKPYR